MMAEVEGFTWETPPYKAIVHCRIGLKRYDIPSWDYELSPQNSFQAMAGDTPAIWNKKTSVEVNYGKRRTENNSVAAETRGGGDAERAAHTALVEKARAATIQTEYEHHIGEDRAREVAKHIKEALTAANARRGSNVD